MTDEEMIGALCAHLSEYGVDRVNMNAPGNGADEIVARWLAARDARVRESVLAEVRAGIEALPEYRVQAWGGGTIQKVSKTDALAVLDRAATPESAETER